MKIGTITLRQEIVLLGKPSKLREPTKKVLPRISKPILNVSGIWSEKKTKVKQGISDFVTDKGDTITDDTEKASILNAFFATVFTKEDTINIPSLPERPFQNILDNVVINQERVKKLLDKLKIDKSPGPDGIHNRVLYETREVILEPLTKLLITSLESGKLPDDWKTANVTPLKRVRNQNPTITGLLV